MDHCSNNLGDSRAVRRNQTLEIDETLGFDLASSQMEAGHEQMRFSEDGEGNPVHVSSLMAFEGTLCRVCSNIQL